ncbi:DUF5686 and carboxypeptidase-like regulatory domain-containing protein [Sunxiuqinia dokdonensis]|uniref:Carboxypeptidase-like regulatory domain-containing protein n=1 Tax=Sunxiuqinia dokdonensis TaxID=1409788 RepID=A0A0L8V7Z6_9BACT|nr:DUF5686 and carboxypeptidase-like regulatory domain-containing protein [Sunxiuqinia dokdonensis]KOH44566.1 hypothetical protein NC99_26450 [Sunxiuqinia dokdonensis]
MFYKFTMIFFLTITYLPLSAREISGYVKDAKSDDPIPFSNVLIKGTTNGIMADTDGFFKLAVGDDDTLYVSTIGYFPKEIPVIKIGDKPLVVYLEEHVQKVGEVTVKPEMERAKVLFNLIQIHKKANRRRILNEENYKTLTNTTVYVAVDTTSSITRLIDNFNEVTVESDNGRIRFSPVYMAEQAQDMTHDGVNTLFNKEDGIFPRINQAIESLILLNVSVDLDFYKDQVNIMERGFISPLSSSALLYYNLYLNDSTVVDDRKFFNFSFAPKNKYNPLFSGHFVVEDGSFALTEIDVYIARQANLNFVNGFKGRVDYLKLPDGSWFYDEQRVQLNMSLTLNKDSLSNYSSKRADNISNGNWLINKSIHYSTSGRLNKIEASDWGKQPEFVSSQFGADSYSQIDKLKGQEVIKGIDKIGGLALTSYFNVGKIDLGPAFDIYSTNRIEGSRFTVPIRTSEQMFKKFSVGGFLGYGTRNKEFKYGVNLVYQPGITDKFLMRVQYANDYNLVSQNKYLRFIKNNPNNKGNSNFIAAFTASEKIPYLLEEQTIAFRFEYNTPSDIHFEASPYFTSTSSTPYVQFSRDELVYDNYKNYGVLFNTRIAFGQHYDKFFFDRVYYSTPTPVINLSFDIGQTTIPDNATEHFDLYYHFHGSIQGRILMRQVFVSYMLDAGYLFGDAPFNLLDQPVGSMSFGYAKYSFNLLHHASFAHNIYTNLHMHLNGGGIILNKIPLIRTLKLREIVSLKCHYGDLGDSYTGVFDLPQFYNNKQNSPYAEIGFGLTNIFKVLRVEYVHQLGSTYAHSSFADRGGIFFRAEMSF